MNYLVKNKDIKDMIYNVRGKEVMLDSDLAILYGCVNGTKTINQSVKRNIERFPSNFYFQLTKEEYYNLKSQIGTASMKRTLPYAFTEQGVAMLSSVLRTKDAARVSVNIMNAFVEMRKIINENKDLFKRIIQIENKTDYIENTLLEHDNQINKIFDKFNRKEDLKSKLFFNGEIYDSYSLIVDIIKEAKEGITIIDNYIDENILKYLKKKGKEVKVTIITSKKSKIYDIDIEKFNKQYNGINIKYTSVFHDRFITIDNKKLYHLGTSLNYIGSKVFAVNKIEDTDYINLLLNKINS